MTAPNSTTATKPIRKLLDMMDDGELVLPEIQREFVWTKKSIKLLVDSLYQGLPIGHMLIWKTTKTFERKEFDKRRLKSGVSLETFYGYLLDGQQRLTALSHIRDGDEEYPLTFNVWPQREADGDETFYWRKEYDAEDPWCIPVGDFLSGDFNLIERLNLIKSDEWFRAEHEEIIHSDLLKMRSILDYPVGLTEFETDDHRLATELFVRFNSTGSKLRRSDLFVAELALYVPGLVAKDIRRAQGKWKHFSFTVPFLVQCLIAVHTGRFRLEKPRKLWTEADPNKIKESWKQTEAAIGKLLEFLTGTVRWTSESLVPSFNALIPLVVILAQAHSWTTDDKRLARRWLLLASVRGYFSGAAQTQLDTVLRKIGPKPSIRRLWAVTSQSLRRLQPKDFQTARLSGPVMSLFLSMLRYENARDWLNTDSPLDGTVIGHNAELHIHHFFPRALLNKQDKLTYVDINTFANYTVINAKTNLNVGTEEPKTYLTRLNVPDEQLKNQAVPLDKKLWSVTRYKDFLTQRRKLLAEQANKFLGISG